jgi:hypothetical protein
MCLSESPTNVSSEINKYGPCNGPIFTSSR